MFSKCTLIYLAALLLSSVGFADERLDEPSRYCPQRWKVGVALDFSYPALSRAWEDSTREQVHSGLLGFIVDSLVASYPYWCFEAADPDSRSRGSEFRALIRARIWQREAYLILQVGLFQAAASAPSTPLENPLSRHVLNDKLWAETGRMLAHGPKEVVQTLGDLLIENLIEAPDVSRDLLDYLKRHVAIATEGQWRETSRGQLVATFPLPWAQARALGNSKFLLVCRHYGYQWNRFNAVGLSRPGCRPADEECHETGIRGVFEVLPELGEVDLPSNFKKVIEPAELYLEKRLLSAGQP